MNTQDYIKAGVKLADGWKLVRGMNLERGSTLFIRGPDQWSTMLLEPAQTSLDALAAQLVRQVDAIHHYTVTIYIEKTDVEDWADDPDQTVISIRGIDRTMNTIKAIVDSGVLDPPEVNDE